MRYLLLCILLLLRPLTAQDTAPKLKPPTDIAAMQNIVQDYFRHLQFSPPPPDATALQEEILTDQYLPDLTFLHGLMRSPDELGSIAATPISDLFQINIGNDVYYLSRDGRYLIEGNMLDLNTRQNMTELRRNQLRRSLLQEIPPERFIHYNAAQSQHQVTVFIDVNCPYCRTILENAALYNNLGISMQIAPFPRSGSTSSASRQLAAVWCATDRKTALGFINQGLEIPMLDCTPGLNDGYSTALRMGVTTVPTFVLEDGRLIPGYMSPENLHRLLQELNP